MSSVTQTDIGVGHIGKYELLTRLAVGGMAEIYLAVERSASGLERTVVLKRILPQLVRQGSFRTMFLREARTVARITHPNVVKIHELGEDDEGVPFISMEYIHGTTARELQNLAEDAGTTIPFEVAASLVAQACRGLHAAHGLSDRDGRPLGLVHRDISPHNLIVTAEGHLKLLDFGIAKATEGVETTYSGALKGKFSYMSPEQCSKERLDRRSDIFGLGIVLWELLTGRRLFKRETEMAMVEAVIEAAVLPPSRVAQGVPEALDAVVLKALQRRPDDRYATAEAFRVALEQAVTQAGRTIGADPIASFIQRVAGDQLEARRQALQKARDHTLASTDWRRLRHERQTGPDATDPDGDEITSVERPSGEVAAAPPQADSSGTPGNRPLHAPSRFVGPLIGLLVLAAVFAIVALSTRKPEPWQAESPQGDPGAPSLGRPLPFGWPPYVDAELVLKETEPFQHYLERELRHPVPFVVTDSYADTIELLLSGELAFAALPPLLYVRARAADSAITLLAIKQYDGTESYDGWLVVRQDSAYRTLEDLRGERFCLTNEDSTSGYFLPRHHLVTQGYDPVEFIGEVRMSGNHTQALRDVLAGKCEVAATYNGAVFAADDESIATGQLRLLATTGRLPQDVVVAGSGLSDDVTEAMRRALLAFDPHAQLGRHRVGSVQRITGFSPASDSAFDELRAALRANQQREAVVVPD